MPNTFHYIVIHVERVCAGKNWGKNIRKLQRLGPFIVGGRREDAAQNLCQLRSSGARDWKQPAGSSAWCPGSRRAERAPCGPRSARPGPATSPCVPLSARPEQPSEIAPVLCGATCSSPGLWVTWSPRLLLPSRKCVLQPRRGFLAKQASGHRDTCPKPPCSKVKAVGPPCRGEGKPVWWQLVHVAELRDQGSCPQASFFLLLWQPRDTLIFLWGFGMWLTEGSRIPDRPPHLSASHFPYL